MAWVTLPWGEGWDVVSFSLERATALSILAKATSCHNTSADHPGCMRGTDKPSETRGAVSREAVAGRLGTVAGVHLHLRWLSECLAVWSEEERFNCFALANFCLFLLGLIRVISLGQPSGVP